MKRLVIISNRVANPECSEAPGGLGVCVLDSLRERGALWFGWNGEIVPDDEEVNATRTQFDALTLATAPLTERDYNEYYLGFANAALWPVPSY